MKDERHPNQGENFAWPRPLCRRSKTDASVVIQRFKATSAEASL